MFAQYQYDFDSKEVFAEKYFENMGKQQDPYESRDNYLEFCNTNSLSKFPNPINQQDEFFICSNISLKVL